MDAPSFEDVKGLIAQRKPPLSARVVETKDGVVTREARVVHDGINGWMIDDGTRLELRAAEDRVTFVEAGGVERIGPGMVASSNTWVKVAIDGRRGAYLDVGMGEVLGQDDANGRTCWLVRAEGLKANEPDAVFLLHVDAETGVVVRTAREDREAQLDVMDLVIGSVYDADAS